MDLFKFVPQCCDANIYLKLGEQCGINDDCYSPLHPMGVSYWFSIPYRLGLDPACLIIGHYCLLVISIVFSVLAVCDLYQKRMHAKPSAAISLLIICVSASVHILFLWPDLRTSLSDAPASLLVLIGVWLLILSPEEPMLRVIALAVAGMAFGLAAWIRAFFLYPIIFLLSFYLILWIVQKKSKVIDLVLLVAVIPILFQFAATYKVYGKISYISPALQSDMYDEHLNTTVTGYDTILPFDYHTWHGPCDYYSELSTAIKDVDIKSLACLMSGRINFYLGSYAPNPYLAPFEHRLLPIEEKDFKFLSSQEYQPAVEKSNLSEFPENTIKITDVNNKTITFTANKFYKPDNSREGYLLKTIPLKRGAIYQASFSLWSKDSYHYIKIEIRDHQTKRIITGTNVILTPNSATTSNDYYYPLPNAIIEKNGLYDLVLSSFACSPEIAICKYATEHGISVNTGEFYVWNPKFIRIDLAEPHERIWSRTMLSLNLFSVFLSMVFIRSFFTKFDVLPMVAGLFPLLCFAAAMATLPEQRFVIFPMITFWIFSFSWFLLRFGKKRKAEVNSDE